MYVDACTNVDVCTCVSTYMSVAICQLSSQVGYDCCAAETMLSEVGVCGGNPFSESLESIESIGVVRC